MTETNGVDVLILSNGQKVSASYVEHLIQGIAEGRQFYSGENPIPATLPCSEVVERLLAAAEATDWEWAPDPGRLREEMTEILHSWRERRVQELEEALRACMEVVWSEFHVGDGVCGEGAEPYAMGEKALANSEQIRKGAKHE